MPSILDSLKQMIRELEQHPHIELLHYHFAPGLSSARLKALEAEAAAPLDATLRQFYMQSNGVQLAWRFVRQHTQVQVSQAALSWDFCLEQYQDLDGCIWIQPLQTVLEKGLLDAYSPIEQVHYRLAQDQICLEEQSPESTLIPCFSFKAYWQKILQHRGSIQARPWRALNLQVQSLDQLALEHFFYLYGQAGQVLNLSNPTRYRQAKKQKAPSSESLAQRIEAHQNFLANKGGNGKWQMLLLNQQLEAVYHSKQAPVAGQALFEHCFLPPELWDWREVNLPHASFHGSYMAKIDMSDANLNHALFCDACLDYSLFVEANLQSTDFSRASLLKANFRNANLQGADFENCNLQGADFRGALLDGARFPGANLNGILY